MTHGHDTTPPQPISETIDSFAVRDLHFQVIRTLLDDYPLYELDVEPWGLCLSIRQIWRLETATARMRLTIEQDRKRFPISARISDAEILRSLAGKDGDPDEIRRRLDADHTAFLSEGARRLRDSTQQDVSPTSSSEGSRA